MSTTSQLSYKEWLNKMIGMYRDELSKMSKGDKNYEYSFGQLTMLIICEQRLNDSSRYKLPGEDGYIKKETIMKNYDGLSEKQHEQIQSMQNTNGQLMVWVDGFTYDELIDLEKRGIVYHVFHGPQTFGAITYHLN